MITPTLRFTIDKEYDTRMIYEMVRSEKIQNLHQLSILMGPEVRDMRRWRIHTWLQVKQSINSFVNARYQLVGEYLQKSKKQYQESWNQINEKFFNSLQLRTGYPCEYGHYTCVVSAFHRGVSNWNGNVIARIWTENPYTMRKMTGHEIIIAHIFGIFRADSTIGKLTELQIWKIAEISGWCLTGLDKQFLRFWPWINEQQKFPLHHNYPDIVILQKKLGKIFIKRSNFREFLRIAVTLVKKSA